MSELSLSSRYLDLELHAESFPLEQHPPNPATNVRLPPARAPRLETQRHQQPKQPFLMESSGDFRSKVNTWLLRRELELQSRTDRKLEEDKQRMSECTFTPKIKRFPIDQDLAEIPFDRRLYADSRRRLETRRHAETLRTQLEEQISDPKRVEKKIPIDNPIEQRTQEFLKAREEKRNRMRSELSTANLFRPIISDRSRAIADASGRTVEPVETRLLRNYRASRISRSSSPDERETLRYVRPVSAGFMGRQNAFVQGRAKRLEIVDSEINRDCTFNPTISRRSRALSIGRGERNSDAVTQRLGVDYVEDQKRKSQQISDACKPSFHPTITPMSEVLAATGRSLAPVHDRLYREAFEKHEATVSDVASHTSSQAVDRSEIRVSELLWKNPKYQNVPAVYDYSDTQKLAATISDQISRREERLQTLRMEQEAKQLAECTFNPVVSRRLSTARVDVAAMSTGSRTPRSAGSRPVLVRGLDRFLELRSLAETRKAEDEERQRKCWHLETMKKPGKNVITVPAPFNLSRSPKKANIPSNSQPFSFPTTPRSTRGYASPSPRKL